MLLDLLIFSPLSMNINTISISITKSYSQNIGIIYEFLLTY